MIDERARDDIRKIEEGQARVETALEGLTEEVKGLATAQAWTDLSLKDLASAQMRTEESVKELALAQWRTEESVKELSLAQRRTDESVKELALAQRRTDESVRELAAAQTRTDLEVKGLSAEVKELAAAQKRTDESVKELAAAQMRTDESVARLADSMNRGFESMRAMFGQTIEEIARETVPYYLRQEEGIEVEEFEVEYFKVDGKTYEVDLCGSGRKAGEELLVLCEAKTTIDIRDVERFARTAAEIAAASGRKVYPVMFPSRCPRRAKDRAAQIGVLIVPWRYQYQ